MVRRRRPPRPGALTELSPLKIFTQIITLQLTYYVSASILILFSALVAGNHFSIDLVLNWRSLRGDTTVGWMLGMVWMLNSVSGVVAIMVLVHRSKLVLDFALTLHLIHLITVSFYSHSFPRNFLWWALQFTSASIMTVLGVFTCQWRELRPISFGANSGTSASNIVLGTTNDNDQVIDPERGRIGDFSEAYEMVRMKNKAFERAS